MNHKYLDFEMWIDTSKQKNYSLLDDMTETLRTVAAENVDLLLRLASSNHASLRLIAFDVAYESLIVSSYLFDLAVNSMLDACVLVRYYSARYIGTLSDACVSQAVSRHIVNFYTRNSNVRRIVSENLLRLRLNEISDEIRNNSSESVFFSGSDAIMRAFQHVQMCKDLEALTKCIEDDDIAIQLIGVQGLLRNQATVGSLSTFIKLLSKTPAEIVLENTYLLGVDALSELEKLFLQENGNDLEVSILQGIARLLRHHQIDNLSEQLRYSIIRKLQDDKVDHRNSAFSVVRQLNDLSEKELDAVRVFSSKSDEVIRAIAESVADTSRRIN